MVIEQRCSDANATWKGVEMANRGRQRNRWQSVAKRQRSRQKPSPAPLAEPEFVKAPESKKPDTKKTASQTQSKGGRRAEERPQRLLSFPERPGRLLAAVLFGAIIVFGNLAAPAIVDPASVPQPWSNVTDWVCVAVVFCATSTLTSLMYCLMFFRDVEPTRNFLRWVTQYAGIGAVLGTLLGCRMALPLVAISKSPGSQPFSFVGFLGVVSNTATMLTLLMIAACWWRLAGLVTDIARTSAEEATPPRWAVFSWLKTTGLVLVTLVVSNFGGYRAAEAVWIMLN